MRVVRRPRNPLPSRRGFVSHPFALVSVGWRAHRGRWARVASWPLVERFGTERFFEATRLVTILFATLREAASLAGAAPEDAARRLAARHPMVVVKLGAEGALLVTESRVVSPPSVGILLIGVAQPRDGATPNP